MNEWSCDECSMCWSYLTFSRFRIGHAWEERSLILLIIWCFSPACFVVLPITCLVTKIYSRREEKRESGHCRLGNQVCRVFLYAQLFLFPSGLIWLNKIRIDVLYNESVTLSLAVLLPLSLWFLSFLDIAEKTINTSIKSFFTSFYLCDQTDSFSFSSQLPWVR